MECNAPSALPIEVRISPGRTLYVWEGGLRLGGSSIAGRVEIGAGGIYVDGSLVVFRRALRCPVRVRGTYLCAGPPDVPRFLYREIFAEDRCLNAMLRVAELHATSELNGGNCLARYLRDIIRGAPYLWDIYYRRGARPPGECREILGVLVARGLRERRPYSPPALDRETGALLGLLRFGDALESVSRSWRGFAVAMRYGIYSALTWRLPPGPDSWLLLFGIYAALDPVVVPGGVALSLDVLRALPYLVARVMGRWIVAFNSAGLYAAAGNINVMVEGARRRDKYASCDGDRCTVGRLRFNQCVDMDCGIVRTWDFEFKGAVKCSALASRFVAVEPCK
ncbi:MAG: hypothetical protein LM577_05305 [Thermoproteaceae archaeon]|nr:hypothetical protein [Thermoproteaceae archaeon]